MFHTGLPFLNQKTAVGPRTRLRRAAPQFGKAPHFPSVINTGSKGKGANNPIDRSNRTRNASDRVRIRSTRRNDDGVLVHGALPAPYSGSATLVRRRVAGPEVSIS